MIIYKDCFTGDELFSDSYKVKTVDEVFYEVEGKMTTETTQVSDSMFGGNASTEATEEDESADGKISQTGCNIVIANRLVETQFTKKDFQTYIKGYIKRLLDRIKENNPQREAAFKKAAQEAVMKILGSFDKWQFFMGTSTDAEAMICLMNFRDDGITPYMLFWKEGLLEEKV